MNRIEQKHIKLFLTPSLLSAGIGTLLSMALIIGATVISLGKSGRLKTDLFAVDYFRQNFNGQYHSISQSLDSSKLVSQTGLWLFWAVVGFIAYMFAMNLFRVVVSLAFFKKSLKYTHAKPAQMIHELFLHLTVRVAAFIIGWLLIRLCIKNILPYFLTVINGVTRHWTIIGEVKLVGVMLVLLIIWHALTLILRLLTLRPRVFGYSI